MLYKKMLRDMAGNKGQFFSIFLMAFLGVFIYAGIGGEWMGLRESAKSYYEQTNMADIWLYGEDFSDEDVKAAQEITHVDEVTRRLTFSAVADISGDPSVTLYFTDEDSISSTWTVEGMDFDPSIDGIWLDDRFVKANELEVGDTVILTYETLVIEKEIMGTIYNPEYVYMTEGNSMMADYKANGFAWLGTDAFPMPDYFFYNQMLITTDLENAEDLESEIEEALDGHYSVFMTRESLGSYVMFRDEVKQHKSTGFMFPIVFLGVALLTMLTTMTRLVNSQRVQIGTLKALGFQKRSILLHYVFYGFWMSLCGAVLGVILGPLLLPQLFYPSMQAFYTLPEWKPTYDVSFYLVAAFTVAAATGVTYLSCRRLLKDTPSSTLRPKAPRSVSRGLLDRLPIWKKLGFNPQWNIRDIRRNKIRSFMAVFGVLGCSALLICANGMYEGMEDIKNWQYNTIYQYTTMLSLESGLSGEQVSGLMEEYDAETLMEQAIEIRYDSTKKTSTLTVLDQVTMLKYTDVNKNIIELPEEGISISYKLANQLGVEIGDIVEWHIYGNNDWIEGEVTAIYRTPTSQGITISRQYLEENGEIYAATSLITNQTLNQTPAGVSGAYLAEDMSESWDELTGAMVLMVVILFAAAALLAIVVLYNLGLLSFMEMERELATLKVTGFQTGKLQELLLTQNLLLSAAGFLAGIPTGRLLIDIILASTGDSFDMAITLHATNIFLSLFITLLLCIFVNLMFRKKIKRIDMVEALKGVE